MTYSNLRNLGAKLPSIQTGILLLTLSLAACGGELAIDVDPNSLKTAPTLTSTSPADKDVDVMRNTKLAAFFDQDMGTLSATKFTLMQGDTKIAGTVATSENGMAATFSPESDLAASTVYTATIGAGTGSATGATIKTAQTWSFTTGTETDTEAPVVESTHPLANVSDVAINTSVSATFSKTMDPLSITADSFTVMRGADVVSGSIAYGMGNTITFTPDEDFAIDTLFTATFTADVKDLQGNALQSVFVWAFTTGQTERKGPPAVLLGDAGNYAILAKTGIDSVPDSSVTGHIAVSPALENSITGFSLVGTSADPFWTSTQVVGNVYAADMAVPTPANLTEAVKNMQAAYTDAAGRPTPDFLELGTGNIGGLTLVGGLYKWTSTITIPTDVTLSGGPNDVWIFQTSGGLTMDAAKRVTLIGGAQAKNVFWQVAGPVEIGAGAHFQGVVLAEKSVLLKTESSMVGRILSQTRVDLQKATVTQPAE